MDPYKVLGVTPQTSDDDVKRAYRELARKYHPDTYVNNPLADLAEARMKEINQAYDMLTKSGGTAHGGRSTYQNNGGGQQQQGGNPQYGQVRAAINSGNLALAEHLLQNMQTRDAEWHFLMGVTYMRKGWYDEARQHVETACSMNPSNPEYQTMRNNLSMGAGYGGYRPMQAGGANCNSFCMQSLCLTCLCNGCCGGCF